MFSGRFSVSLINQGSPSMENCPVFVENNANYFRKHIYYPQCQIANYYRIKHLLYASWTKNRKLSGHDHKEKFADGELVTKSSIVRATQG